MSLSTITRRGPEISDAIVSVDPVTLQRTNVDCLCALCIDSSDHVLSSRIAFGEHQQHYQRADLRTFHFIRPVVVLAGAVWGIVAAPGRSRLLWLG